ncbi:MAG: hypothetical protein HUU01_10790 [Saprospiraceae bacterium]|nr:hypothetical protein [Saprospiraceae bacterium]
MIGLPLSKWKWKLAQALEWRWWQYYLSKRPKQVYLDNKRAYWRKMLEDAGVTPKNGDRLLDAGCGPAGLFILPLPGNMDALDPLLENYKKNLTHFTPEDYPRVRFLAQPLESFNAQEVYHKVFCFNAINHVKDLETSVKRLADALQTHGTMLVSVDVHKYQWLKKMFQYLPGDVLHPHQYDSADYHSFFARQGLILLRSKVLKQGLIFDYYLMVFEKRGNEKT